LPSQTDLGRRYRASRHAVRRAMAALKEDGVLSCWQGREATVVAPPVLYRIGHKTRLASGLRSQGHSVDVSTLQIALRRRLPPAVAKLLDKPPGACTPFAEYMHVVDGVPTALGRHYFDGARFPNIVDDATTQAPSVPEAFVRNGVDDYFRTATVVEARLPTSSEAIALEIPPSQSRFCLLGRNVDATGAPIEVTEAIVRSDTVKLQIETHQVGHLV
ncbi:MAG: UTRA domain-containing protein, partial [Pseudomonadota bacterium]